jgi:hypothetical protein
MPETKTQNFQSHARIDPPFHFFLLPVAFATVIIGIYDLTQRQAFSDIWFVVVAVAFLLAIFKIRTYPLKVQDRVIRLEERMRLTALLPEPLKSRIPELSEDQLVALRFASDAELPELVEKTLANQWTKKEIKAAIVNWRPDYFRI